VATLWECIQRSAGEGCGNRFCVKAIDKRRFKTKTDRDTATREISFYRWLSRKGPNTTITSIPKCYDCLEDKNHYYLVLEYEAGGNNLGMLLRDNGPLSESQMQLLAVSLLQSLLNLHDRSICHNDLHLENVLIRGIQTLDDILAMTKIETQQSVVKFCDLGRALCVTHQKIENGPSSQSTHVLSPIRHSSLYYMAPEVLGGMPPGLASDMWSVGVILFACFSGEYPFQCDPQQASVVKRAHLKRQIRQGDYAFSPPQWQQVSRSAKQFVSSLLHVDPVVRMTCREALLHPWIAHVGNVVQPTALKKSRSRRSVSSELSGKPSMPSVSELSTHTLMSDGSVSTTSSSQVTMGSGHKKSKSLVGRLWGKIKIKHRSTKSENDMSTIASSTLSSSLSQRQLFTPPVQQDVVEQQAAKAEKSL
jgi:calcium/calmodulin-dependent protein kinase I